MKEEILQRSQDLGFDDCRVTTAAAPETNAAFERWIKSGQHGTMHYLERNAHKRMDPQQVLSGACSIIVLATSYANREEKIESDSKQTGIIARYAQFKDYHDVLADRLKELTAYVGEMGGAKTKSLWYVDTGPLLERDLAQRAGIGFVGKHTNVISRKLGNWFFLSEIITTLPLPPDSSEKNRCGTCTRCLQACPTGAITAPFNLDARLCISYLTIELKGSIPEHLRPLIGNRIYGCDICLEVCPWNRFAKEGSIMKENRRSDLEEPDLLGLLSLDDSHFKTLFRDSPILRTKRRGLLRNVCVALGNIGTLTAVPALKKAAHDAEPLIVEHALWAISQIEGRSPKDS